MVRGKGGKERVVALFKAFGICCSRSGHGRIAIGAWVIYFCLSFRVDCIMSSIRRLFDFQ